jgi:hypothetical protein
MEWRAIQGFENYEVSNTGEVRNIKTQRILGPGINKGGYRLVGLMKDSQRTHFTVHRLVAVAFLENPKEVVDHADGNTTNNHVSNLRWASRTENSQNKKMPSHNKSGVKGVHRRNQKWKAEITIDGINLSLGTFETIEDARQARIAAVQKAFGNFAHASERENT